MLTQDQVEEYHREGFILVPNVFDISQISELGRVTDEFIEKNLEIALLPKMAEARKKSRLPDVGKVKNETLDLIKAGHLKADTLIIWGFNDRTAPYSLGIELLKIISPVVDRTQLHIFNQAGHFVFREHPLEVNRLIVEFIKSSSSN